MISEAGNLLFNSQIKQLIYIEYKESTEIQYPVENCTNKVK